MNATEINSLIGGYSCAIISVIGALLNLVIFIVISIDSKVRKWKETIKKLSFSFNVRFTPNPQLLSSWFSQVLMLFIMDLSCQGSHSCILTEGDHRDTHLPWQLTGKKYFSRFFHQNEIWCKIFAFSFYVHMGCILMVQGILAVSRYLTVCRQYRWNFDKIKMSYLAGCLDWRSLWPLF